MDRFIDRSVINSGEVASGFFALTRLRHGRSVKALTACQEVAGFPMHCQRATQPLTGIVILRHARSDRIYFGGVASPPLTEMEAVWSRIFTSAAALSLSK